MIEELLDKIKSKEDSDLFISTVSDKKFINQVKELDVIENAKICEKIRNKAKAIGMTAFWKKIEKCFSSNSRETQKKISSNTYEYNLNGKEIVFDTGKWIIDDISNMVYQENREDDGIASYEIAIITGRLTNIETDEQKFQLTYKDSDKWSSITQLRSMFSSPRSVAKLSDYGIIIAPQNAVNFCNYIADFFKRNSDTIPTYKSLSRLGFVGDGSEDDNQFIPLTKGKVVCDCESNDKPMLDAIKPRGSYQKWKDNMLLARKSDVVRLYTDASFASPLIKLLGINSYIVHLWGETSKGKSVSLKLAMSVWGKPNEEGIFNSSGFTQSGLEGKARFLQNIPLSADEITKRDNKELTSDSLVYMITNGGGRTKRNKDGKVQKADSWKLIMMSTAEMPITKDVSAAGAKTRCIEIQSPDELFSPDVDLGLMCDEIEQNYGHAGKEFIELIVKIGKEELIKRFNKIKQDIRGLYEKSPNAKQLNAVASLKLADDLVSQEILKTDKELPIEFVAQYIKDEQEIDSAITARDIFLAEVQRQMSTFDVLFEGNTIPSTSSQTYNGRIDIDNNCVYANYSFVSKILKENGYIFSDLRDRWQSKNIIHTYREKDPYTPRKMQGDKTTKKYVKFLNANIQLNFKPEEEIEENEMKPF